MVLVAMDRTPGKPARRRAGFLFCIVLAYAADASAQRVPMTLNRPPAAAPAEPSPPPAGPVEASTDYLTRMDADRDGRVSLGEYQDWLSYAFTRMDANGDGTLTPEELPGGRGKPVALAEHRQTLAERFARQDRDRSGFLDAQELLAPPQ